MNFQDFKSSLSASSSPPSLSNSLQALWHDGKGDWNKAHNIAQEIRSPEGSWIHAYLHRKEGDEGSRCLLVSPGEPTCLQNFPRGRVGNYSKGPSALRLQLMVP